MSLGVTPNITTNPEPQISQGSTDPRYLSILTTKFQYAKAKGDDDDKLT